MVISRVDLLPFMTVHLFQRVNCSPSGSMFSSQVSLTTILSCVNMDTQPATIPCWSSLSSATSCASVTVSRA